MGGFNSFLTAPNRGRIIVAFSVFFIGLITKTSSEGLCNDESITTCTEPMQKFGLVNISTIVPNFTVATIKEICKIYPGVEDCMRPLWGDCPSFQRHTYEGLADNYDYICNDTWEEYLQHRECLGNNTVHERGNKCNVTLENNLQYLDFYSNKHNIRSKICTYFSDYLTCVYNVVKETCGSTAAVWQKGFDESHLDPLMADLQCVKHDEGYIYVPTIPTTSSSTGSTLLTMVLPIILLLVLLAIVVFLILYLVKRRKKYMSEGHDQPRPHPGGHEPPPAFDPVAYRNGQASINMGTPGHVAGHTTGGMMDNNGSFLLPPPYSEKDAPPPTYSHAGTVSSGRHPSQPQASSVDPVNVVPPESANAKGIADPTSTEHM